MKESKSSIQPLLDRWRTEAEVLRRRSCLREAALMDGMVEEAEDFLDEQSRQPLTLQEAAEFSGYSADHLGRLIRKGTIPNRGRPGAPRVTRQDLPTKPVKRSPVAKCLPSSDRNPRQIVQSIIHGDR